ncbi:hypothetical protein KAFR_0A07870 [Kazachstania africana CBS 2517]|uniref:Calcineurin-like phosphoesterase domain-containing protein n=1 Tax=Kazachstania africana (strain ATCC 22294 / BCRC 22015 / CBS 2517 / CECT 1963 / NBRC 1671 / NRRL Y-8276) TaxID=1071382 RepID=H2APC1_KAZAF|nr:hypothetical protein KAFR_0A07870 [Kazachstania africana CBS 2517]CCF56221.1 hypothetical protein KAFR_0A07870 [Kazachstania africana CBS 2517]
MVKEHREAKWKKIGLSSIFVVILVITYYFVRKDLMNGESDLAIGIPKINVLADNLHIDDPNKRIVFVGDVHGQFKELDNLINKKLGGLDDETLLILLGDFTMKGPDSEKVIDFILDNKANVKCLLGNHEVSLLLAFLKGNLFFDNDSVIKRKEFKVTENHVNLANKIGFRKLSALARHCSVLTRLELGLTDEILYGVHAGMLPNVVNDDENKFNVNSLVEMKYVNDRDWSEASRDKDDISHPVRWYKIWEDYVEKHKELKNITILYGHDARKGLNIRNFTKGLDSACVKGGKLSAMEYTYDKKKGKYNARLIQQDCL